MQAQLEAVADYQTEVAHNAQSAQSRIDEIENAAYVEGRRGWCALTEEEREEIRALTWIVDNAHKPSGPQFS